MMVDLAEVRRQWQARAYQLPLDTAEALERFDGASLPGARLIVARLDLLLAMLPHAVVKMRETLRRFQQRERKARYADPDGHGSAAALCHRETLRFARYAKAVFAS